MNILCQTWARWSTTASCATSCPRLRSTLRATSYSSTMTSSYGSMTSAPSQRITWRAFAAPGRSKCAAPTSSRHSSGISTSSYLVFPVSRDQCYKTVLPQLSSIQQKYFVVQFTASFVYFQSFQTANSCNKQMEKLWQ